MSVTLRSADDLVSPELVLVDPELARRVRPITLTGAWTPAVHAASIRARSAAARGPAVTSPQRPVETHGRRSLHRVSVAVAVAAGSFLVVTTLGGTTDYPPTGTTTEAPSETPHQAASIPVPPNLPAPKPPPSRPTAKPKAQGISWQRARFATFYRVVFIRAGAHRLQVSTARTGLSVETLRSGQGLRPGRYRWFVRPGYGNPRLRKVPGRTFYGPITSRGVLLVRPD